MVGEPGGNPETSAEGHSAIRDEPADRSLAADENFYRFAQAAWPATTVGHRSAFEEAERRASKILVQTAAALGVPPRADGEPRAARAFYDRLLRAAPGESTRHFVAGQLLEIEAIDTLASMAAWFSRPGSLVRSPIGFVFGPCGSHPPRRAMHVQVCVGSDFRRRRAHAPSEASVLDDEAVEEAVSRALAEIATGGPSSGTTTPVSRAALSDAIPEYPWDAALSSAGVGFGHLLMLAEPDRIRAVARHFSSTALATWKAFARARIRRCAADVDAAISQPVAAARLTASLYPGAFADGVVQSTRAAESFAVRELFVQVRGAFVDMVERSTVLELEARLQLVRWLTDLSLDVGEGCSDNRAPSSADPDADPLGVLSFRRADQWRAGVASIGQPLPIAEFRPLFYTAAAAYEADFNAVMISPALVCEPFFCGATEPATTYGSLGAIIGHEIAHAALAGLGIGRHAASPAVQAWWRGLCGQVRQRYQLEAMSGGSPAIGEARIVEEVCDRLGLAAAFAAFVADTDRMVTSTGDARRLHKRVFLAWARTWFNWTPSGDAPYASRETRTNEVVRDIDGWYDAFAVRDGAAMYVPAHARLRPL